MTAPLVDADAIPDELQERDQWLLWDKSADTPRRPHWRGNFGVSWSNPAYWHTFDEAVSAANERDSWGIGYVFALGNDNFPRGLYGCLDIDGGLREAETEKPKEWVPSLQRFIDDGGYVEYSPSGDGIHIPVVGREAPEWWTDSHFSADEHEGIEYLEHKFCTFTGNQLETAGDDVTDTDPTPFLFDGYEELNGEAPRLEPSGDTDATSGDYDTDDALVADALDALDPNMSYPEWRDVAFAVHAYDDSAAGKALFTDWSRGGSKWNDDAEKYVDAIWTQADPGDGITAGTLFHKAKQQGFEFPNTGRATADGGTTATTPAVDDVTDDGDDTGDERERIDLLTPEVVCSTAGVGDDGDVSDLNDREKAACVWSLLWRSDEYHVRVRRDNGGIWAYDGGVWTDEGARILRHAARKALGSMNYGANVLTELEAQARSDPRAEVDADAFGVEPGTVAVANGLLDLEAAAAGDDDALRELRPEDYALAQLPVEYDPDARCTEWEELVDEWAETGKADALQEFVGYCLHVGALPIHRVLLLVGSGANGKSVFLNTVRSLLGDEHTAEIGVQTLANEPNAVADFYGKLANIDDDLSSRKLGAGVGMFKKLSAGNRVRARQLYEEGFGYEATGKQLYSANEVPNVDVGDDDDAFWRRWLLVEFPNHYPPGERDPSLKDRLSTPDALSGVLNWAITGWHRLLHDNRDHFTGEERYAVDKRERWQSWGDSIDQFITKCVEHDDDADNITTGDVHRVYAAWCRENGEAPASQQALTNTLKGEDVGYAKSARVEGSVQRAYTALRLTDDAPDPDDTPERGGQQSGLEQHGE